MKQKIIRNGLLALALLGLGSVTQTAKATFISGSIYFAGDGAVTDSGGVTSLLFQNTGTYKQTVTGVTPNDGSNSYFPVPTGTVATFSTISLNDPGHSLTAYVNPLWTFTTGGLTYSFELTNVLSFSWTPGVVITLGGTGIATITGGSSTYSPTSAIYSLSGVYDSSLAAYKFVLTDETTAEGVGVPDGGMTLTLLGAVLAGLGAIRFAGRKQLVA